MSNLKYFVKKKFRLVLILGGLDKKQVVQAEKVVKVNYFEDLSCEKLSYLRADLIILGKYQSDFLNKEIINLINEYTHEAGLVLIIDREKYQENLLTKTEFRRSTIPGLYVKKPGLTPKEYDIEYLKRWGATDFLKNWKLAGEQILAHIPSGLSKSSVRILDIGCLNGYIMETLRMNGVKKVYGCDISYEIAINHCINKYHLPAIRIEDFCNNHYPDKFSDLTIAMEILEHIPPDKTDKFISELKRVTSDNGKILISTSEDMNIDPTHINCRKRIEWYYIFAKHGLIPSLKQTIFPGFNNFVFHKTKYKWQESTWRNISRLFYLFNMD